MRCLALKIIVRRAVIFLNWHHIHPTRPMCQCKQHDGTLSLSLSLLSLCSTGHFLPRRKGGRVGGRREGSDRSDVSLCAIDWLSQSENKWFWFYYAGNYPLCKLATCLRKDQSLFLWSDSQLTIFCPLDIKDCLFIKVIIRKMISSYYYISHIINDVVLLLLNFFVFIRVNIWTWNNYTSFQLIKVC